MSTHVLATCRFGDVVSLARKGDEAAILRLWQALGSSARRTLLKAGLKGANLDDALGEIRLLILYSLNKLPTEEGLARKFVEYRALDVVRRLEKPAVSLSIDIPALPLEEEPVDLDSLRLSKTQSQVLGAIVAVRENPELAPLGLNGKRKTLQAVSELTGLTADAVKAHMKRIKAQVQLVSS